MKEAGGTICNLGLELRLGSIIQGMRVSMKNARNMAKVVMIGPMAADTKANGSIIKFTAEASINGLTAEFTRVTGSRI